MLLHLSVTKPEENEPVLNLRFMTNTGKYLKNEAKTKTQHNIGIACGCRCQKTVVKGAIY